MGSRDSYLQVRISATEKAELERRARRAGQDVSTYVRSRVLPITRERVQTLVDRLRVEQKRDLGFVGALAITAGEAAAHCSGRVAERIPGRLRATPSFDRLSAP